MFNDRYGLTQAVIDGRKTMTRRLINPMPEDCTANHKNYWGAYWSDEPMALEVVVSYFNSTSNHNLGYAIC